MDVETKTNKADTIVSIISPFKMLNFLDRGVQSGCTF